MAQQGQYVGETVLGVIGENVNVGQVIYCKSEDPVIPGVTKGAWFIADADITSNPYGDHQLGVALEVGTFSTISSTQSGTEIQILLKGYYSPGQIGSGGYCYGNLTEGAAIYLMTATTSGTNTKGAVDGFNPTQNGATQSILRVVGYAYDVASPYILRFEPDKSWMAISNSGTNIELNGINIKNPSQNLLETLKIGNNTGTYSIIAGTAGSASKPMYSFANKTDMGMFQGSPGGLFPNLSFATGGKTRFNVDDYGIYFNGVNIRPYYTSDYGAVPGGTAGSPIIGQYLATDASGYICGTTSISGGSAGSSGTSGSSGLSGSSGSSGSSGANGVSGSSGSSGANGSSGSSGTSGTSAPGITSGTSGVAGLRGVDGANILRWVFNSPGAYANPGSSYILADAATASSITKVSISKTANGVDATNWLSGLSSLVSAGNTVYFYISTVLSPYFTTVTGIWTISSMTNNSTWYDLGLTLVAGSNTFTNGADVAVSFVANGKDASGSSGSSGTSGGSGSSGTSGANGSSGTSGSTPIVNGIHSPGIVAGGTINTSMSANGPGTGGSFLTANRIFIQPFVPFRTFTSTSISCEITTTGGAANLYLRVYDDVNGAPTNFLFGGTFSATSTGVKTYNYSYQFQAGRLYWFGCNSDGTATMRALTSASSMILQYSAATSYSGYTYAQTATSTTISGSYTLQNLGTILVSVAVASVP